MNARNRLIILVGLLLAGVLAALISPFASSAPDGLERVAANLHFDQQAKETPAWRWALFPDYLAPGLANEPVATGVAGLLGVVAVFAGAYGLSWVLRRRRAGTPDDA